MTLFQLGAFTLHSGDASFFKIDCDALTEMDLATLAAMLAVEVPAFGAVEGVPRGGLRIAAALQRYVTTGPLLIVDDVLTTSASMEARRAGREALGAVLFARGPVPRWIRPLFKTSGRLWTPLAGLSETTVGAEYPSDVRGTESSA